MEEIVELLQQAEKRQYGGERVSQLAHALQCAHLAEQAGASSSLIVACLFHDIGHLVDGGDAGVARRGIDARHEVRGAHFLSGWFGEEVTLPVRLHVDAKRYLCATQPGYFDALSPVSVRSLEVQGGVLSAAQATAFIGQPYADEAVTLRRWDEQAKDPDAQTPELPHFVPYLEAHLRTPGEGLLGSGRGM